jgi:hypothetical protein
MVNRKKMLLNIPGKPPQVVQVRCDTSGYPLLCGTTSYNYVTDKHVLAGLNLDSNDVWHRTSHEAPVSYFAEVDDTVTGSLPNKPEPKPESISWVQKILDSTTGSTWKVEVQAVDGRIHESEHDGETLWSYRYLDKYLGGTNGYVYKSCPKRFFSDPKPTPAQTKPAQPTPAPAQPKKEKVNMSTRKSIVESAIRGVKVGAADEAANQVLTIAESLFGDAYPDLAKTEEGRAFLKVATASALNYAAANHSELLGGDEISDGIIAATEMVVEAAVRDIVQPRMAKIGDTIQLLAKIGIGKIPTSRD